MMTTKCRSGTGCRESRDLDRELSDVLIAISVVSRRIADRLNVSGEGKQHMLCDNSELEARRDALQEEITVTVELTQNMVAENARVAQDQDDYNKRYNALVERYERLKSEYEEVCQSISGNEARYEQMGMFIKVLQEQAELITEFDEALWGSLVEKLVVKSKDDVTVVFKDGTEIKAE